MTKITTLGLFAIVTVGIIALAAYAEYETMSPYKQFKQKVSLDEIQCIDSKKILLETPRGLPACVSAHTADVLLQREGWNVVTVLLQPNAVSNDNVLEKGLQVQSELHHVPDIPYTDAQFITLTNPTRTDQNVMYELWNNPLDWPRYNMTFPTRAIIGEPIEIVVDYAYLIPDEDTGRYTHPEHQCSPDNCKLINKFWIGAQTYVI